MGSPNWRNVSRCPWIASRMLSLVSSNVRPRSHATRKIRHVSGPVRGSLLENYCVLDVHFFSSNPADLRIAFSVPTGMSSPGLPGTVTTCGFAECLKWRWLPLISPVSIHQIRLAEPSHEHSLSEVYSHWLTFARRKSRWRPLTAVLAAAMNDSQSWEEVKDGPGLLPTVPLIRFWSFIAQYHRRPGRITGDFLVLNF